MSRTVLAPGQAGRHTPHMVKLTPDDPRLEAMVGLELHESVFQALVDDGAIVDGFLDPDHLEAWAATCDNPAGQRASLVRAIAQLRRLGPLAIRA
jgi:hypothetical protein